MPTRRFYGRQPRLANPNVTERASLQRNLLATPPSADPLGLAVKARAREAGTEYAREQEEQQPGFGLTEMGMSQARASAQMNASGWGGYLQALKEAAQRIAGPDATLRVAGGSSAEGSTQLRGTRGLEFGHGARAMEISAPEHRASGGIASNPDWWVSDEATPTTMSQLERRMAQMPASLHGLYTAGFGKKART